MKTHLKKNTLSDLDIEYYNINKKYDFTYIN